jgi:hypothetical protein
MEKITSENRVHAMMMKMMISRGMIRVIDETVARRGKTADTMILTLWPLDIPTDETIGTMTGVTIFEITTSAGENHGNYKERPPRVPELPFAEQLNAPCYLHAYIDPKDNVKKSSHLLRDCRQFIEIQKFYETRQPQQPKETLGGIKETKEETSTYSSSFLLPCAIHSLHNVLHQWPVRPSSL